MQFDKEALQLLQETATAAEEAEILELPENPRLRHVRIGTTICEIPTPPLPRREVVRSLDDLIAYAVRAAENIATPVVWHDGQGVVLCLDDSERHDYVRFPLTFSPQIDQLAELESLWSGQDGWMNQQKFVLLLRCQLGVDPSLINPFRRLDWQQGNTTTGDVQHGRDRMGNELTARVNGLSELPEEMTLMVPVYQELGERQPREVACNIILDSLDKRLALVPKPGELDKVCQQAQVDIGSRLTRGLSGENEMPIYYGSPTT